MQEDKSLHSLDNLRAMEIIDINTGAKLGFIKDLKIDCEESRVLSIILPSRRPSWFGKSDDIEIPWKNVKKIGVDVVLVDGDEYILKE
ncbi:YlmC/YmxH family sporulation protein [Clostridium thailandense]|uniref:YlmC/YmxH family sporulation protein n=1 Tax=Clostridium thailandense TaxID=2794346 RepID=A0A949TT75_9CLOT|nr:YlmC/YmxH family sporulation protein [Clostridium thailandense]MBV7271913.1 YlmC/YmxH family sporulation protein [Clostridium thailandense]MCH5137139.1 YlmC/YmxH family sporulation protein [Clostridiaceae bacterium UIB06]